MLKYFDPLKVFLAGNFLLLMLFLFFSTFGNAADQLAADTANMSDTFWAWGWAVSNVRLWIYIGAELAILYATAKVFISKHDIHPRF